MTAAVELACGSLLALQPPLLLANAADTLAKSDDEEMLAAFRKLAASTIDKVF
jgi:hypothetical protein